LTGIGVTNSTVLISLDRLGQIELLRRIYSSVFAPPEVRDEVGIVPPWLAIRAAPDPTLLSAILTQVGSGEAAAIALASSIAGAEVVLDDLKARRLAQRLGLRLVGTPGLLVRAKQLGFVPSVLPLLLDLRARGFRMSIDLFHETLRLANEDVDVPMT
jgi:uncharacterized protein